MNTCDPADRIGYVRMSQETDPYPVPVETGRRCTRLPIGYANRSSRTCLTQPRLHARPTPRPLQRPGPAPRVRTAVTLEEAPGDELPVRCDQAITVNRRRQEHDGHACAVCTREVPADDPCPEDVVAEAETLQEAAEKAERTAQAELDHAARELRRLRDELDDVDARLRVAQGVASLPDVIEIQSRIWQLEGALSVLPAPAASTANAGDGDGSDLELRTLRVLAAAQKVLEKDNRAAAAALFDELNNEITMLGLRFGIAGLEAVSIDRGARLRVVQEGGVQQWFSDCTGGAQLRLRIAVVIALLRIGAKHGVATHPS